MYVSLFRLIVHIDALLILLYFSITLLYFLSSTFCNTPQFRSVTFTGFFIFYLFYLTFIQPELSEFSTTSGQCCLAKACCSCQQETVSDLSDKFLVTRHHFLQPPLHNGFSKRFNHQGAANYRRLEEETQSPLFDLRSISMIM